MPPVLFRRVPVLGPVRLAISTSSLPAPRRLLHLQASDATSFLSTRLAGAQITSSPHQPSHSLAILLHADRRLQSIPSPGSAHPNKAHFGPSLLGCHQAILDSNRPSLGLGDLGILNAQREQPSSVAQVPISLESGLELDQAHDFVYQIASIAGLSPSQPVTQKAAEMLRQLWCIFKECEGIWFTGQLVFEGDSVHLNAPFLEFDDFALHRVEALKEAAAKAKAGRDVNTAKAEDGGLFYIKLNNKGNVGSFGYGAGNAMATMDGLSVVGGTPANFLDGGGGANVANARLAIETLHQDPSVKSIFVNTFGGLTRCSLVAEGIIEAVKENGIQTPMTVRVMGTESDEAKELLRKSGLPFEIEDDFKKAAKMAVEQANGRG